MSRMPEIGGGSSQLPIAEKDVAETFTESDVTLTHDFTTVTQEKIEFVQSEGAEVPRAADDSGMDYTGRDAPTGLLVNPNKSMVGVTGHVSSRTDSTVTDAYLFDSNDNLLDTDTISSGSFRLEADMNSGEQYAIAVDDPDGTWTAGGVDDNPTSEYFDYVGYYAGGLFATSTTLYAVTDVAPLRPVTSGTAYVEWPEPNDVFRWDAATFQATPDGETVTIDVEESTDGGATWTTIATDITRGQDISNADPSGRVRLVANLDRTDTANNPTVDAVARRWVL